MANNCWGSLNITGKDKENILAIFRTIEAQGEHLLPVEGLIDPVFDVVVDDWVTYWTKWSPNIKDLISLFSGVDCEFEFTYSEFGNEMFGQLRKVGKSFEERELTYKDFEQITEDVDEEYGEVSYSYQGTSWDSLDDLCEKLIEDKEWLKL
jgi:hypothetical protein